MPFRNVALHARAIALAVLAFSSLLAGATEDATFGPLYHEFPLTLAPGDRTEILGPMFYHQRLRYDQDVTRTWAVPPLVARVRSDSPDYLNFDFLWKGLTYHRYGEEYRFQVLQLFSFSGGGTQSDTNVHRFTLFPFYFHQWSKIPEKNYFAFIPFYGHLYGRLFRDEVKFVLMPLYVQSRKRDVVTDNYVYPFVHTRHGPGMRGWQVWPLLGHESKAVTTKTNHWGDEEISGGHKKSFALWPFWLSADTEIGTTNAAHQRALIPFYSGFHSPSRDSVSYGWPLGYTHTVDREKRYEEHGAPWPLIVFAHGPGKFTRRVWPFFSHAHNATLTSDWYLWPTYKYNRFRTPSYERERTRLLLFLYSEIHAQNRETGAHSRQRDLWPLFTWRREFDGSSCLQIFSPLEPFVPNNSSVERDLAPLWSVWRAEHNPATGAASQSLLWNLYRRDTTPTAKKVSLLFGLIQYQSAPEGRRWRLFYLPTRKPSRE